MKLFLSIVADASNDSKIRRILEIFLSHAQKHKSAKS